MSKFCTSCGTQVDDTARFCKGCGSPFQAQGETSTNQTQSFEYSMNESVTTNNAPIAQIKPAKAGNKVLLIIIAIVIAAVAILLIATTISNANSYEKPIKNFVKAINDRSVTTLLKTVPKSVFEEIRKNDDDFYDNLKENIDRFHAFGTNGEKKLKQNLKFSYEIIEENEVRGEKLKSLREDFIDEYDFEITDARFIIAEIGCKNAGMEELQFDFSGYVIKVDGKWYCDPYSLPVAD